MNRGKGRDWYVDVARYNQSMSMLYSHTQSNISKLSIFTEISYTTF